MPLPARERTWVYEVVHEMARRARTNPRRTRSPLAPPRRARQVVIRAEPSISSKRLGCKARGALVEVTKRQGAWVQLAEGGGGRWMLTSGETVGLGRLMRERA